MGSTNEATKSMGTVTRRIDNEIDDEIGVTSDKIDGMGGEIDGMDGGSMERATKSTEWTADRWNERWDRRW